MSNTDLATETTVNYVDSKDNGLEVGDRVYTALETVQGSFDENYNFVAGRTFDFGEVDALNEDGTVTVWWDSAGCSCESDAGRPEKPAELVKMSNEEALLLVPIAHEAFSKGYAEGVTANQQKLRNALGLLDPTPVNDN